ncbi:MAG: AMP-binding protein [Bacteroidota bacterium]
MNIETLTLPDLLTEARRTNPENGIGFIQRDGGIHFYTYPQLFGEAVSVLSMLQSEGIKAGDKIILSISKSEEIVKSLWACFLGGIIPAIVQPPLSFTDYNPASEKIKKIFYRLDQPRILYSTEHQLNWDKMAIDKACLLPFPEHLPASNKAVLYKPRPDETAFIQFSSGSTGEPKGIILTHSNLIHNMDSIIKEIKCIKNEAWSNWMPLYHDMGLIGFHMVPLMMKTSNYIIDTQDFIKNPLLWLDVLDRYKVGITACPNFAQEIVRKALVRYPERTWDLSHVRLIFNGAEPISPKVMFHFLETLAPFGLKPSVMLPAYGMAEATLAIAFTIHEQNPRMQAFNRDALLKEGIALAVNPKEPHCILLVNHGTAQKHSKVKICNEKGDVLPDGRIGDIKVIGPNITSGYFNDPVNTAQLFSDGWMNTGDLGFIFNDELYITGRRKDIIFINGSNYFAQDLEEYAYTLEGVARGKFVISGYFDAARGKDLILAFIVGSDNDNTRALCKFIRREFSNKLGIQLDTFIPVKSIDIQRTSSGKLQRYKLVEKFLAGSFQSRIGIDQLQ